MVRVGPRPPLIGRETELTFLREQLARASQGEGSVALVAGEPGIGKTRLLAELAERARSDGWTVLSGAAYDTAGMPPYLPFIEALRSHLRTTPPDRLHAQLGSSAATLVLLLPELDGRLPNLPAVPPVSPEQERYRLFEGVCDAIEGIARAGETGLLLLLDDLHWADAPSLQLLQHLSRRLAGVPLLVVAAYRSVGAAPSPTFVATLAALARTAPATPLVPAPLGPDDTSELVEHVAGQAVAVPVAITIHQTTEGNPFFIGELVRHLQADGRDLSDAGIAGDAWTVPELIRQVIAARLT
jgi:predicted ATPase